MNDFDLVSSLTTVLATVLIAPLLQGSIRRVKAFWQGRHGPPLLQSYLDLWKLARKESIVPSPASWIFLAVPPLVFGAAVVAAALVPIAGVRSPRSAGDLIVVVGCLALARFALALGALDTGSSFGAMGASREMAISALVEPSLLVALLALALPVGSTNLARLVLAGEITAPGPASFLAFGALLIVAIAETGRIPVDNPDTHLELTMVHEGMLLEYSGRQLLLVSGAALVKQVVILSLIIDLVAPWGINAPLPLALIIWVGKLAGLGCLLACIETAYAKLRILRLPDLLASAFALGGLSVMARAVWGG